MIPLTGHALLLTVHVVAATVWVGGQLSLAALVPVLRRVSPDAPRVAARRFNIVAWGAFAVLVVTGTVQAADEWGEQSSDYRTTLVVKLVLVALSGVAAFAHARTRRPVSLAVWGALSLLSALTVVLFGVLLVTGEGEHAHA
jgi:putative copper export protein